ncbi:hypothetical protein H8B02_05360 [Bradyrhizobium sp. Pear77]|uniref:hypothetical protein n=1 Tax=Bradyrhizobium altum TaxID=1571202 RepID=UPI001E409F8C|nr:hypothetical protein [Bradyrhizobium altum]MCC8952910.1 hypothetical protein [Bradyrhizobium altum]
MAPLTATAAIRANTVKATDLNYERVMELVAALRERTPAEVTIASLALGASFTPEMWLAREPLRKARSSHDEKVAHDAVAPPPGGTKGNTKSLSASSRCFCQEAIGSSDPRRLR